MKNSFFYNTYVILGQHLISGLNNSLIVSNLLNNSSIDGIDGFLKSVFLKTKKTLLKTTTSINKIFHKSLSDSYIIKLFSKTIEITKSNLIDFILATTGSLFVFYSLINLFRRMLTIKIGFIFIIGCLILILAYLDVDKNNILDESKIIGQIRNFFDYEI